MSSILRALRKLEEQSLQGNQLQTWPDTGNRKEAINARIKRIRRVNRFLAVSLACIIILGTFWYLFSQKPIETKRIIPGIPSSQSDGKEADPSIIPMKERDQGETKPVRKKETDTIQALGSPKKESHEPDLFERKVSPLKEREKVITKDKEQGISQKPMPSEKADGSDLELQAIVWSDDPAERIAVIDGKIVREGESVGEFSILRIETDAVFVRRGEEEINLVFKLK